MSAITARLTPWPASSRWQLPGLRLTETKAAALQPLPGSFARVGGHRGAGQKEPRQEYGWERLGHAAEGQGEKRPSARPGSSLPGDGSEDRI